MYDEKEPEKDADCDDLQWLKDNDSYFHKPATLTKVQTASWSFLMKYKIRRKPRAIIIIPSVNGYYLEEEED